MNLTAEHLHISCLDAITSDVWNQAHLAPPWQGQKSCLKDLGTYPAAIWMTASSIFHVKTIRRFMLCTPQRHPGDTILQQAEEWLLETTCCHTPAQSRQYLDSQVQKDKNPNSRRIILHILIQAPLKKWISVPGLCCMVIPESSYSFQFFHLSGRQHWGYAKKIVRGAAARCADRVELGM